MNTTQARAIFHHVGEMIELASIFQSRYGKDYRMKPGSPADAWNLHNAIFDLQTAIASSLDLIALEKPLHRLPRWWEHQDIMDTGMASTLSAEVCHLLACCAAYDGAPGPNPSPAIRISQQVVAGLLHPMTCLMGMEEWRRVS